MYSEQRKTSQLKKKAISGIRWSGVSTATTACIQIIQIAILARVLVPEDFGLMAIVLIVIGFGQGLSETGLSQAIIQRKECTRKELSSLYWFNIVMGIATFLLIIFLAPWIAKGFGAPEIKRLLQVVGIGLFISSVGIQFQAITQKRLRFDLLAWVDVSSALFNLIISVYFAMILDYGVWSLVWGYLGGVLIRTIFLIYFGWSMSLFPALHFKISDLKGYLAFGLYRVGANWINSINSRSDQLIIGAFLGVQTLGYYNVAVNLVLQPIQKFLPVLTRVAFPVFSIVQDDIERLRNGYLEMIRFLMFFIAPLMLGVAVVAPIALPLFIGNQWNPAIPLAQILAIYAMIRSLGNAGGSLILARGYSNWTFYWNLGLLFVVPPVLLVSSLSNRVEIIAWSLVGLQVILFFVHYRVLIRNLIGDCLGPYLIAAGTPFTIASIMSLSLVLLNFLMKGVPPVSLLTFQIVFGTIIYFGLTWLFKPSQLRNMVGLLLGRI